MKQFPEQKVWEQTLRPFFLRNNVKQFSEVKYVDSDRHNSEKRTRLMKEQVMTMYKGIMLLEMQDITNYTAGDGRRLPFTSMSIQPSVFTGEFLKHILCMS